ncbi:unnamed protein product [Urochloa humidicola]
MSPPAPATDCPFSHCLCSWHERCTPRIPSVVSGRDYVFIPADAADGPAWSVLVGIMATSSCGDRSLRLHRFRVSRSGRVLDRSRGALEVLGDDYYKAKTPTAHIRAATATRSPDGRSLSLCFFCREVDFSNVDKMVPPLPLQLHMDLGIDDDDGRRITVSSLPALPSEVGPLMPICPISAAGDLWAPYLTEVYGPSSLVMQRFDKDAGKWVPAAAVEVKLQPLGADMFQDTTSVLQGYVVVGDTILLSLWPSNLFYTFNCSTCSWAAVATTKTDWRTSYIPIHHRGVYVEEDDTIYFLYFGTLYAYKLCKDQGQHRMELPTEIDRICPFGNKGYGFLSHLGGRVMCAVWIGVKLLCNCDSKHVLITTFRVKGDNLERFVPKGVRVLHSTSLRLDMSPSKPTHFEFSFLQEYKESTKVFNHEDAMATEKRKRGDAMASLVLLEDMEAPVSSNVVESSKMLSTCREFFNGAPIFCPVMLKSSAIRTSRTLYIICQVASHSTVYKINIVDGRLMCHDRTLTPHCIPQTCMPDDMDGIQNQLNRPGHFVYNGSFICATPSGENRLYLCYVDKGNITLRRSKRPIGVEFRLVVRVGKKIVGIGDTLQDVYHLFRGDWILHETSGPSGLDLGSNVTLSGYVVLSSTTFMVSDAKNNRCFLCDIVFDEWSIVKPLFEQKLPPAWPRMACLSERCVLVNGFIYTCSHGGLAAYELVEQHGSYYLGERVDLQFSWRICWERNRMCLEHVGKDTSTGAIMFCMMKDDCNSQPGYTVRITTVQVETERMADGKLKPKTIGHVDIGTIYVEWSEGEGRLWTRKCFAAKVELPV